MTITAGTTPATARPPVLARLLLCQAPVGEHGIVEATVAWKQMRQHRHPPRRLPRHTPLISTEYEEVAVRLTRVLTGTAWAVVSRAEAKRGGAQRDLWWVEVPTGTYHRVVRTLTGVWREVRAEFAAYSTAPRDHGSAAALWRMAMLIDGAEAHGGAMSVRTAAPSMADVLIEAARVLNVVAVVDRSTGAVTIRGAANVRRLLERTGVGHHLP